MEITWIPLIVTLTKITRTTTESSDQAQTRACLLLQGAGPGGWCLDNVADQTGQWSCVDTGQCSTWDTWHRWCHSSATLNRLTTVIKTMTQHVSDNRKQTEISDLYCFDQLRFRCLHSNDDQCHNGDNKSYFILINDHHLTGDWTLFGVLDTEHWISSSCLRIVSASSAISCWSEGGGTLTNCWHLELNSSLGSRGRDLVLVTFFGILLMLTSWLNLTWRDSETEECSDLSDGVRFTYTQKIFQWKIFDDGTTQITIANILAHLQNNNKNIHFLPS